MPEPSLPVPAPMAPSPASPAASIQLGGWSFYFIAKFLLHGRGLIDFHALENLAFAAALLAPLPPAWRRLRLVLAVPVAVALLYHESWLPPFSRLWSQATLLTDFSADYLLELAGRFVNVEVVALLVLAWAAQHIVSRYIRVGVLVTAALLVLAVMPYTQMLAKGPSLASAGALPATTAQRDQGPDALLRDFYAAEARRVVSLPDLAARGEAPPFDLVFLHVCSLSWDDLQFSGLDGHPLWSRFDALFTRFNSAASYSGPSAIRIHRALCGQTPHQGLYDTAADSCYLFPNLKRAGFTPELALNHDGHFDDFLSVLRRQGLNAPPLPLEGTPVPQRGFDDSPIHDDLAVLARWLDGRTHRDPDQSTQARAALYYNTISLHDGNKLSTGARLDAAASYRLRAGKLFDDINAFLNLLEQSGRRVIVVLTPEHGAALRGDRYQIAGLRDMPTPQITNVPVGVKVIGARREDAALRIDQPSSYLGLSQLLAQLIATPPYPAQQDASAAASAGFRMADYARQLPATHYVADNDGTVMLALPDAGSDTGAGHYLVQRKGQSWQDYAP